MTKENTGLEICLVGLDSDERRAFQEVLFDFGYVWNGTTPPFIRDYVQLWGSDKTITHSDARFSRDTLGQGFNYWDLTDEIYSS